MASKMTDINISLSDEEMYNIFKPSVGYPADLRDLVSYWDEIHKRYLYPIKIHAGLLLDMDMKTYFPFHGYDENGNKYFALYVTSKNDHGSTILNPVNGIIHTMTGFTISCYDGYVHNPEYPAVESNKKGIKIFALMGRELSLQEFVEQQKDTEHFNKIFALYFGEDGTLNFDNE